MKHKTITKVTAFNVKSLKMFKIVQLQFREFVTRAMNTCLSSIYINM